MSMATLANYTKQVVSWILPAGYSLPTSPCSKMILKVTVVVCWNQLIDISQLLASLPKSMFKDFMLAV